MALCFQICTISRRWALATLVVRSGKPQRLLEISLTQKQYLVASFIGCAAGGPFLDWLTRVITKRHGGYFVPEFRLWAIIPSAIFFPVGLLMYGAGLEYHLHYMIAIVGSAIGYAIVCAVPSIGMTYVLDCYRPLSNETMTMVTAAKNVFSFGISFAAFPWIERDGYLKVCQKLRMCR